MLEAEAEFRGTERYQVLRRIGAGGMGVVYEAEDRERGQKVALKTIARPDVDKIYKLKREFRALADLSHPNLAALYDLVVAGETCFFTMELLAGEDFLSYVAPVRSGGEASGQQASMAYAPTVTTGTDTASENSSDSLELTLPGTRDRIACDEKRLRAVLPQLARGLVALHEAGKVHRDIKPSNIQVTPDGRVVLLDFGLVTEMDDRGPRFDDASHLIVGTVAYMAPEQAASDPRLTPAADWYAVGVLIYQALTGRLPFQGSSMRILMDKQSITPAPPRAIVPVAPRDLDELATQLLARDPRERPDGWEVLRRLGVAVAKRSKRAVTTSTSHENAFAGREAELGALEGALAGMAEGKAAVALVSAASGMGKTALVQRFLERARGRADDVVILAGRCYEREAVPYKAVDSLIDHLSNHWLSLSPAAARELLPRDASLLPTLFPVLGRVPAVADAPAVRTPLDPQERRTHAFAALRQVLQRLGDRHPLILFLDDLQWVDADTMALLADLMRAPDPPSLMLLLATRAEGRDPMLAATQRMDAHVTVVDLPPLGEAEAIALATRELGSAAADLARRLVREAGGSPFFLLELIRYMEGRGAADLDGKGLEQVLGERLSALGEHARALVELIAVAGEPIARRTVAMASSLSAEELARQLTLLRVQRFVKVAGGRADDLLEPYHDRIRETLARALPDAQRQKLHRALATALGGHGTSEQLARHWLAAGESERAAEHAQRAAEAARTRLDFHRAADFFRMALDAGRHNEADARKLRTALANALVDAGRSREAADVFAAAAEGADATTALELRRRAADALLHAGYMTEGIAATKRVLAEVGLALPETPGRALLSLLRRRAWLRLRGLGFTPRPLGEITQEELTRVDVCEGVSFGLAMVDTFRSADFATRFLAAALELGERTRVTRALALEADFLAVQTKTKRAEALLARLAELTEEIAQPWAVAQLRATQGLIQFLCYNRWRHAYELLTEASALHKGAVGRAGFEVDTIGLFLCWALQFLGELGELSRRVPALVEAAERDGDRYAAVTYRCAFPFAWLPRASPEDLARQVDEALRSWAPDGGSFQMQHFFALNAQMEIAIYRGDPESVTRRIAEAQAPLKKSMLARPATNRVQYLETLGRHALACAAAAPPDSARRKEALAEARKATRGLATLPQPAARPAAMLLQAGAAAVVGDRETTVQRLRAAEVAMATIDTALFLHAIRFRLGQELGGSEGLGLLTAARDYYADQNIPDAEKFVNLLAPGWPLP